MTYVVIEGDLAIYDGYGKLPRLHMIAAAIFWIVLITFLPKARQRAE
ncbi:hypothetical protein [Sphingomonas sp. IC-56]|nr:hypothetical protein [Sphingomonas sp. IC-56]